VVEHLPRMHEALSLNPRITKKKEKKVSHALSASHCLGFQSPDKTPTLPGLIPASAKRVWASAGTPAS
jgi:hypothetical protein